MKYLFLMACLVLPASFTRAGDVAPAPAAAPADGNFSGKVVEAINTAGYTYVLVDTGSKKLWAAATEFPVKVGDTVTVNGGMPMTDYHSKTLKRDFDVVYFTGGIEVGGQKSGETVALPPGHPPLAGDVTKTLPPGHPPLTGQTAKPNLDLAGIKKADGGRTIQEIFAAKATLAGNPVTVRGKVVKYNAAILGKNWLHIQDGTGKIEKSDNDLAVTTTTAAKVGDTVLVTGSVSTNRDFGGGYKYSLILEDAKVSVE